jgi:hypothetical protein
MFPFLLGEGSWQIVIIFRDHFAKIDWTVKHEMSILKISISADSYSIKKKKRKEGYIFL